MRRCGRTPERTVDLPAANSHDGRKQANHDVNLALVLKSERYGHGYMPSLPALGTLGVAPGSGVAGKPLAAASSVRSQVETRSRRFTSPPCCPVSDMARTTKNVWSRSRPFTKRMICG